MVFWLLTQQKKISRCYIERVRRQDFGFQDDFIIIRQASTVFLIHVLSYHKKQNQSLRPAAKILASQPVWFCFLW
jgi:hypothetical protein